MRIALVCPYDLDMPGGVQTQCRTIATALAGRAHEVLLVGAGRARERVGPYRTRTVGISVAIAANGSRAPVALTPDAAVRTIQVLRGFAPDVVHLHEPFAPLIGPATLLGARAPIVGTFHRAGAGRGFRLAGALLRPLGARIDRATAVSASAAATARAFLGEGHAFETIPNALDVAAWRAPPPTQERSGLVFVGRHEERKGLAVLLEALAQLDCDVPLRVVGDGPQTNALRARARGDGRIVFLGTLDESGVRAELRRAAIYVAPSLGGESFGVVLLEAMAAGAAVVASDIAGYRAAAGDGACFVAPGVTAPLAGALEALLVSPERRAALVARGSARVASFDIAVVLPAYEALYQAVQR